MRAHLCEECLRLCKVALCKLLRRQIIDRRERHCMVITKLCTPTGERLAVQRPRLIELLTGLEPSRVVVDRGESERMRRAQLLSVLLDLGLFRHQDDVVDESRSSLRD